MTNLTRASGCRVLWLALIVASVTILCQGCALFERRGEPVIVGLLAVLPIEPAVPAAVSEESAGALPPGAGQAVTSQVYRVLAHQTAFRFVPDLLVIEEVKRPTIRNASDLIGRAVALGKAVEADGVIFGRVFRFRNRLGTALDATVGASVSFELALVVVETGEEIWRGEFDRTQEHLGGMFTRFFHFVTYWRPKPHWYTAGELAAIGAEKLLDDMTATVHP